MTLPVPSPDFTWAVLVALLAMLGGAVLVLVRWLLARFLRDLEVRQLTLAENVAKSLHELKESLKGVVDEKNRAHNDIWVALNATKDRMHAIELALAKSATAQELRELWEQLKALASDVHALKEKIP